MSCFISMPILGQIIHLTTLEKVQEKEPFLNVGEK